MKMKFGLVFPGQGSQSINMMHGFAESNIVKQTFAEAAEILNQDLWEMIAKGPEEDLNSTLNTQPIMLTAGVAVYRLWQDMMDKSPTLMAGHSLGEYTALVASQVIEFKDALPLVRFRAQVMQEAVASGKGGMAAILGLDDETIRKVCAEAAQSEVLEAVNFNCPGQTVIAGHKTAVERGVELAKTKGAKRAVVLPVSVPSHCALMRPAAEKLQQYLVSVPVGKPQIPVIHNADVSMTTQPDEIRTALVKQLYRPVRWVETIQAFAQQGITHLGECGPGKVLTGLNKRITLDIQVFAFNDIQALEQTKELIAKES